MLLALQAPDTTRSLLQTPVFGSSLTWGQFLLTVGLTIAILWLGKHLFQRVIRRFLQARGLDPSTAQTTSAIGYYLAVAIGIAVVLQTTGVDLSSLTVLAGALGIGIGFGLQNIVGNFVAGLVILLERPIKVGDRVELGTLTGSVRQIGARATTIVTNDEIAIIVPNGEFVNQRVTNWSYTGRTVRFILPAGVSYRSDPRVVEQALLEAAASHPGVVADPQADVVFVGFGDSALLFELRVWTATYIERPRVFLSEMNFAIWDSLQRHGIEIPFPQRDLHIKGGSMLVETKPVSS